MIKTLTLIWCLTLPLTTFAQEEELLSSQTIPNHLKTRADAVVRYEKSTVELFDQNRMTVDYSRVVTVLNQRGSQHLYTIVGYDESRKIKDIEALIYDKDGDEIKKIKKKDFLDYSAVDGGTLYSDSRVLVMHYDPVDYPYTVHFTYTMDTPNTAGIPGWRPIGAYNVSVQESAYQLTDHKGLGMRHKKLNFEGFDIESDESDNSLFYKTKDLNAMVHEDLSPSIETIVPRVLVASTDFHLEGVDGRANNWNEFGNWMRNSLLTGRDEISEETKGIMASLVADCPTDREKAEKIFKYVQDNTRYVSVQVGIGGWQPIAAMEVDKVKYGDCKGLTNYTKALLKQVGVESYYSVVESGRAISDLDPDFASLQGNHIILAIPEGNDLTWVDCTSQIHPFGFIGDFTDNRNVLVIKPDGSEIVRTEAYINEANYQKTEAKATIGSDASLMADVEIKTKGVQYDNRFSLETVSENDLQVYYKNYWSHINNLNIKSKRHINDRNQIEFTEQLNIQAAMFASINGDKLIFTPNAFNRSTYVPERIRSRKLPMTISRGYLDEDSFTFKIPEGYQVEAIPDVMMIENEFGEYVMECSLDQDAEINYKRKLFIKKGDFSSEQYNDYREFRKEVSKADKAIIVLTKTN